MSPPEYAILLNLPDTHTNPKWSPQVTHQYAFTMPVNIPGLPLSEEWTIDAYQCSVNFHSTAMKCTVQARQVKHTIVHYAVSPPSTLAPTFSEWCSATLKCAIVHGVLKFQLSRPGSRRLTSRYPTHLRVWWILSSLPHTSPSFPELYSCNSVFTS